MPLSASSRSLSSDDAAGSDPAPETPATLRRIQDVGAELGLTSRAIRYYEELGLLAPAARSEGAYRLYDADDIERLRFIKGLRDDAGFSLAEISQLLEDEAMRARNRDRFRSTSDVAERRAIVEDTLDRVDRQIHSLRVKMDRLAAMIDEAQARRTHLRAHLVDLEAGREPAPHVHDSTSRVDSPATPAGHAAPRRRTRRAVR
jgi:DNA-binding transcriptional MerR regulator